MKKTLLTILAIILTVTIGTQIANAIGSLTPVGTAGDDTQYSLNDIYDKLTNFNDTPTATSSPFVVPGTLSATFHTLSEVYDLLNSENSDLVPEKIATGTSIFGVMGTLATTTPELIWQTDLGVTICWSAGSYETTNGCSIGNANLTAEGYGAVEYCQNLVAEGSSDWRLPTILEYQTITDFTVFNNATQLSGFAEYGTYWSNTSYSEGSISSWVWDTYDGSMYGDVKNSQNSVRCVR